MEESIGNIIIQKGGKLNISSLIRPISQEKLCVYEFIEESKSFKRNEYDDDEVEEEENNYYNDIFPVLKVIPNIIGDRIPDIRSCHEGEETSR